jgi:transposase
MTEREAQLTAELARCKTQLEQACLEREAFRRENELLRQKVDLLVRRVFGSSSERLDPAQLTLLSVEPQPVKAPEPAPAPLAAPKRERAEPATPRLPENLPVVEEIIEPEPVKANPQDWRRIVQKVSEQLDCEPGRFIRRRLVRPTYVHRANLDLAPVTAPLPPKLQDRCLATPALIAHVVVNKLCDHIPLYRQEHIFKSRYQVNLPRQTLDRWLQLAADWLTPVYRQIRTGVMSGGYVQVDETPIDYLEPGFGRAKQGYLWVGKDPKGEVFFQWETSRGAECLERLIPVDFTGTIQCDGYNAYRAVADRRNGAIKLAACWAHARRKFHQAFELGDRLARWFLGQIQRLYRVEEDLRINNSDAVQRRALRQEQSRPVAERIARVMLRVKIKRAPLPQSPLGKAIDYAQKQWPGLIAYLEDGRVEIDNNPVENSIRPTAVGKKNWLFVGDSQAGQWAAVLYTIVESCRRHQIDPFAYLRDALTRLPLMTNQQIADLLPATWAKAQIKSLPAAS